LEKPSRLIIYEGSNKGKSGLIGTFEPFYSQWGLIPKNPLARGTLGWGGSFLLFYGIIIKGRFRIAKSRFVLSGPLKDFIPCRVSDHFL
jgi:hypothetical protein